MLTEKRYEMILELLEDKRTITVRAEESFGGIGVDDSRRDLSALDQAGKLTKVFGGAVANESAFSSLNPSISEGGTQY